MIRPSEDKDPCLLQNPFHSESLESLKGPQTLGQVDITTPSYIHKYHWPPDANLNSISTNSEGRTRLPPSWEARAKCAPTRDRNPSQRGQTGFHSTRLQKLGLGPVPPSVRWGPPGRLPPPSPWQSVGDTWVRRPQGAGEPPKPIQDPRGCGNQAAHLRGCREPPGL